MSPEDWETRLTAHYLRADGPSGASPLTYLDATPAELALAAGRPELSDAEAQTYFLEQFSRHEAQRWFDGWRTPAACDGAVPGYFRHLVLTCLVSATDEGAGATNNFRIRLGELLDDGGGALNAVSRVNRLWRALAGWCQRQHEAGEPIRALVLPNPGTFTLIGHALRLAFPSWRDREALTRILRRVPDLVRRSPRRLVAELGGHYHLAAFSPALLAAYRDFAAGLMAGRSDAADHRFWRLVQSIDERLQAESGGAAAQRWRLEVMFGGWEQDQADAALWRRTGRTGASEPSWTGAFQALDFVPPDQLPPAVVQGLHRGLFLLSEAPGARWAVDDLGPAPGANAIALARENTASVRQLADSWRPIGGGWLVSGKLDLDSVSSLLRSLGIGAAQRDRLVELGFETGVATRHGAWLGRAQFLPAIRAPESAVVALGPVGLTDGHLSVDSEGHLSVAAPTSGRWRVTAQAGGATAERQLILEADAPERATWPIEHADWEPEREILVTGARARLGVVPDPRPGEPAGQAMVDVLEAVYAGARSGWPEGELVDVVSRALPRAWQVWDVIRALAEGGWIEARLSRRWRARRWRLCPPELVEIAPRVALVEGAVGGRARRRLAETVKSLGGEVIVRASVAWAPEVLLVTGIGVAEVAADMEWTATAAALPSLVPAPACWPCEARTGDGYETAGAWSFNDGRFLAGRVPPPLDGVSLERLIRARGDDRDLFRVMSADEVWITTSRTAAVLEAYRRAGRALFVWSSGTLARVAKSGHLPIPVAKTLRRTTLLGSGPVQHPDGTWSYRYPADACDAAWVAGLFGSAISGPPEAKGQDRLLGRILDRRAGRVPTWYRPFAGIERAGRAR